MWLLEVVIMIHKVHQHFREYFLYDILILFLLIVINIGIICIVKNFNERKEKNNDYSYFNDDIDLIYKEHPEIFSFDQNNLTKISLEYLEENSSTLFLIPMTAELDECVGNIIIKKENNQLIYDYSHICDMIDY